VGQRWAPRKGRTLTSPNGLGLDHTADFLCRSPISPKTMVFLTDVSWIKTFVSQLIDMWKPKGPPAVFGRVDGIIRYTGGFDLSKGITVTTITS